MITRLDWLYIWGAVNFFLILTRASTEEKARIMQAIQTLEPKQ